jgi:phosphate transport system substrate-binding protein
MPTISLSRVLLAAALSAYGCAESISLQGAGATFPAPLYSKWIDTYNKEHADTHIDYQPIGSGGGIKGITDRTVQFAGSDAPLSEAQLSAAPGILHLPTVAGPVVLIFHHAKLPSNLILDGDIVAGIYLGQITTWNDPKIVARNPGVELPSDDIVVVHRSDGSGTSYIFTNYLSKVSPEWKSKVGNATAVKWPVGVGGKGSAGVAQAVNGAEGSIGFVELAYAKNAKLNFARMVNHDGKVVDATIDSVNEAAKHVGDLPADLRLSITDAPGDGSYPICGFTYLLVYQDLSYLKNPVQAQHLLDFIHWCEHDGQSMAAPDYASISDAIRAQVDAKLKSIVCDGKPVQSEGTDGK